ncbi:unnamed protein product [Leptosia nina]|uniref:Uncharacterized protein n=1 Tax=Leptosia nina TaxID=320188 RepID=A0AAV1JKZ5_9NEOP
MKLILLIASFFAFTDADKRCRGVDFDEKYFNLLIVKEGINHLHDLAINRNDNNVFFTYETLTTPPLRVLGYIELDAKKAGIIGGIRNATAVAVDQFYGKVYVGGADGLFKINNQKIPERLPIQDDIRSLHYKDGLYFTNSKREAYKFEDGYASLVPELLGVEVDRLVIDDENNIFFTQNKKLFRVKIGTRAINTHEMYIVDALTTDKYNKPYICTRKGVAHLNIFGDASSELGCTFPEINPFSEVAMKFNRDYPKINCKGRDWVTCNMSECFVTEETLLELKDVSCTYKDIVYIDDHNYKVADGVKLFNDEKYILNQSDYFKVSCYGYDRKGFNLLSRRWLGYKVGIRPVSVPPVTAARMDSLNVLIMAFDSTAYNGFVRKLPKSYKVLVEEVGAVILKGYNIVGDGTPDALFPILSGKHEWQHPSARIRYSKYIHLDSDLFIFHTAKEDGYRTAYYEDMPWIGSFQYRYNGFNKCPADHYLRPFLMEESKSGSKWWHGTKGRYCIGDKPQYKVLMDLTKQFMNVSAKKFCFTFMADISHDEFNMISTVDDDLVEFLRYIKQSKILENTLFILMGDHGPRFSPMRNTYQGKIEERMPFMSIALPEKLKRERPDAVWSLKSNSKVLTTPFDIHTTVLDAMGLKRLASDYKVPNTNTLRGFSLLEPISSTRNCEEAGIHPHWCVCTNAKWRTVSREDAAYKRVVDLLCIYINNVTAEKRSQCAERKLTKVEWVIRRDVKWTNSTLQETTFYQLVIVMSPGLAIFEATVQYTASNDSFTVTDGDISRISA